MSMPTYDEKSPLGEGHMLEDLFGSSTSDKEQFKPNNVDTPSFMLGRVGTKI
jgi:hypothetical protein